MKLFRLLTTSVLLLLISGCSTFQEWFGSEEEDATAPVELERIDTKVKLKKQWSTKIGDGQGDGFYKITPTLVDGVLYVASSDGEVAAISAADGDRLWRVELERSLSGGVGYHDRSLILVALTALYYSCRLTMVSSNGKPLYRVRCLRHLRSQMTGSLCRPMTANYSDSSLALMSPHGHLQVTCRCSHCAVPQPLF